MNVTNNKNLTNTMPSSSALLRVLEEDNQLLRQMLEALIDMYHTESALKKHHKAYLHIREEAEEMCDMFTAAIQMMDERNKEMKEDAMKMEKNKMDVAQTMENPCAGCTECCGSCFDDLLKEILPEHQLAMLRTLEKLEKSGGGVIFTVNAYDKAVDDMLCLCEGIDIMMEVMKAVFSGEPVTKQAVEQLMSMIQCMADEICERWSEMER